MTEQLDPRAARAAARAANKKARLAAKAAFDALPTAERWARFERMGMLLNQQQWIFAKTMAHNPHWYTLRRKWAVDADFARTVAELRAHGYKSKFQNTWYTQVDVNDHFYWTMGGPVNHPNGCAATILINRKPLPPPDDGVLPYGSVGHDLEMDADCRRLLESVPSCSDHMSGLDVLDVGCGLLRTGGHVGGVASYTGMDPLQATLDRVQAQRPDAQTVRTVLRSFVPLTLNGEIRRYDRVFALFGNDLTLAEVARIPLLLKLGGSACVVFDDTRPHPAPTQVFADTTVAIDNEGRWSVCRVGVKST